MSFNKKLWKDYPSLETPINATELNRIEDEDFIKRLQTQEVYTNV